MKLSETLSPQSVTAVTPIAPTVDRMAKARAVKAAKQAARKMTDTADPDLTKGQEIVWTAIRKLCLLSIEKDDKWAPFGANYTGLFIVLGKSGSGELYNLGAPLSQVITELEQLGVIVKSKSGKAFAPTFLVESHDPSVRSARSSRGSRSSELYRQIQKIA